MGAMQPRPVPQPDLAKADQKCKHCYGTGLYGTRLERDGKRTRLICSCVGKAMGVYAGAKHG